MKIISGIIQKHHFCLAWFNIYVYVAVIAVSSLNPLMLAGPQQAGCHSYSQRSSGTTINTADHMRPPTALIMTYQHTLSPPTLPA